MITESERSASPTEDGGTDSPLATGGDTAETCDESIEENWSTQLAEEVDISVGTPSAEDITETEPFSERASDSALGVFSAPDETLESDGAVGWCSSIRVLGARDCD